MKRLLLIIGLLFYWPAFSQATEKFESANELYRNGEFQKAIEIYQSIVEEGRVSSNLYFNLGNAFFKNNQLAEAILFYERALKLNPGDGEVRQNLNIARKSTIDRFEEVPMPIFKSIWLGTIRFFSPSQWAWLSVFFLSVFITGTGFYLFSRYKRSAFIIAFSCLIVGILNLFSGWFHRSYNNKHRPALVMTASSYVKSGPGKLAEDVFILHEGAKLEITESFEDWQKIRLPDGKIGWIESKNVQEI